MRKCPGFNFDLLKGYFNQIQHSGLGIYSSKCRRLPVIYNRHFYDLVGKFSIAKQNLEGVIP